MRPPYMRCFHLSLSHQYICLLKSRAIGVTISLAGAQAHDLHIYAAKLRTYLYFYGSDWSAAAAYVAGG